MSTDSEYAHLAWANTPAKTGGIGPDMKITLVSDKSHKISRDYGVLIEDEGIALRGLFIIDPKGILRYVLTGRPYLLGFELSRGSKANHY